MAEATEAAAALARTTNIRKRVEQPTAVLVSVEMAFSDLEQDVRALRDVEVTSSGRAEVGEAELRVGWPGGSPRWTGGMGP